MASPIVSAAWYAAITTENDGTGPGWSPGSGAGARKDHTAGSKASARCGADQTRRYRPNP